MISKFLKSSLIQSAQYDRYRLEINFVGGHSYIYYDVPYEVFEGLINAASPGAYYNSFIKNKFNSKKIY